MVYLAGTEIIPPAVKALFPDKRAAVNLASVEAGLARFGRETGMLPAHRLAHFLAQLAHESAGFRYDREIWGPTPAQERYDTRTDLGNTPERDGDGKKYMGRTTIQITGRGNVERFMLWCRENGLNPPDFVANPDLLNTDPWEGLAPIWYWTVGNPTGKSLNVLADSNNIEQITKRINGGLNGFSDRLAQYARIALAFTGFRSLREFQTEAKRAGLYDGAVDGDSGPQTRAALHKYLASMNAMKVAAAPVVEEVTVPVAPEGAEKTGSNRLAAGIATVAPVASYFMPSSDILKAVFVGFGVLAVIVMLWRGEMIAARVKSVLRSFENANG
jgi:putative chitinase